MRPVLTLFFLFHWGEGGSNYDLFLSQPLDRRLGLGPLKTR